MASCDTVFLGKLGPQHSCGGYLDMHHPHTYSRIPCRPSAPFMATVLGDEVLRCMVHVKLASMFKFFTSSVSDFYVAFQCTLAIAEQGEYRLKVKQQQQQQAWDERPLNCNILRQYCCWSKCSQNVTTDSPHW